MLAWGVVFFGLNFERYSSPYDGNGSADKTFVKVRPNTGLNLHQGTTLDINL